MTADVIGFWSSGEITVYPARGAGKLKFQTSFVLGRKIHKEIKLLPQNSSENYGKNLALFCAIARQMVLELKRIPRDSQFNKP